MSYLYPRSRRGSSHSIGVILVLKPKPPAQRSAGKIRDIAGRENIRIAGAKHFVHNGAASLAEVGGLCEIDVGFDTDSSDDDVSLDGAIAAGADEDLVRLLFDPVHTLVEVNVNATFSEIDVQEVREWPREDAFTNAGSRPREN
jgi:hypothetical protein